MRAKKTSRFRVMAPTPLQKTTQISPIFIPRQGHAPRFAGKGQGNRTVDAGWDDAKVVPPDGCGQSSRGGGVEGRMLPPAGESMTPPFKN
jgi:hypothetical protein